MTTLYRLFLVTACFTAAFTAGTIGHATGAHAATYSSEYAACAAVWAYHEVDVTVSRDTDDQGNQYGDRAEWERAYRHAWRASDGADPSLRHAIRAYLWTDRGWERVNRDCGFGQN